MKADIKIWILTGDKQETAINIGKTKCVKLSWCLIVIVCSISSETSTGKLEFNMLTSTQRSKVSGVKGQPVGWDLSHQIKCSLLTFLLSVVCTHKLLVMFMHRGIALFVYLVPTPMESHWWTRLVFFRNCMPTSYRYCSHPCGHSSPSKTSCWQAECFSVTHILQKHLSPNATWCMSTLPLHEINNMHVYTWRQLACIWFLWRISLLIQPGFKHRVQKIYDMCLIWNMKN